RLAVEAAREHHRNLRSLLEHAMVEGIPLLPEDQAMLALDPMGRGMFTRLLVELNGVAGRPVPEDWLLETVGGDLLRLGPPVQVEFRPPASRGFSTEDVLLNRIYFLPAGEQPTSRAQPGISLDDVPEVVFSEALRDVALVAQVAGKRG